MNGNLFDYLHSFRKGQSLCLEMSRSLVWLHWGTLALFFVAYTGTPIFWDRMSLYFIIMPLVIFGFVYSWYRVGRERTRIEIIAIMILGLALVILTIAVGLSSSWPFALMGADFIASVCAACSFSLKKTRDYLYIIAASGAILVTCTVSRSTLSLIPILAYLGLLIPVVQFGLKEHLHRTREGNNLSVEAQGKSRAPYSSFILPAVLLLLITAALFFLLPKPLHNPIEEKRDTQARGVESNPADLQKELESPQGQGGTSWSPTAGDRERGTVPGEEGSPSDTGEAPSPDESGGEPGDAEEGGQPQEGERPQEGQPGEGEGDAQEGSEGEDGLSPALLFEVESAMVRLVKIKAFDLYNRGEWSSSTQATEYTSDSPRIELDRVLSEISEEDRGNFSREDMVFHLHQAFGRDMPAGMNPIAVRLPEQEGGGGYGIYEDVNANLLNRKDISSGYSYAVTSFIPEKIILSDGGIPQDINERYAVRYTGCPGLAETATEATAGCETQQEKTFALMDYMKENFSYDPSITLSDGDQSLNIYINQQRSGDNLLACTAMILLCREVGIPARLVTGFIPSVFNEETGRFEVYSSDVYIWVEIYFPHSGWLPYDPTPTPKDIFVEGPGFESGEGEGGPQSTEPGEPSRPSETGEDVETVEGGTSEQQIERSMKDLGGDSGSEPSVPGQDFNISRVLIISIAVLMGLAILAFIGWMLYSWLKKKRGKGKKTRKERVRKRAMDIDSGLYVHLTYKKMCEELAAAGLKRGKSETPDEYMDRIEDHLPAIVGYAEPITGALKDVIYGMREVSGEYLHYLEVCLQYLATKCRAAPAEE